MQHVVFWSSQSGPTFERVAALAEAVELVQRLRNDQGVTDAEVHELTAVPLAFRTVVVVEPLASTAATSAFAAPAAAHPVSPALMPALAPAFPVDDHGDELAPLGAAVPGVVPDPVGPFKSLAAVEAGATEETEGTPHLVGLPSVAPDSLSELAAELLGGAEAAAPPALHAVVEVPDQALGYELPPEAPVRSLGLFA